MNEKDIQNNENENQAMTGTEQDPKTEPKKQSIIVRAGKAAHKKYLEFKANKFGRWIVRGGKVAEGALAVYGLYELFGKKSEEPAEEVVVTGGEIVNDGELEPEANEAEMENPAEEEIIEHD